MRSDWEVIEKYIREHGQQYGTVSWQMARDALRDLRQQYSDEGGGKSMSKKVRVVVASGIVETFESPGVQVEAIDLDTSVIEWECVACHEEFDASQLENLYSIKPLACPVCGGPVNLIR